MRHFRLIIRCSFIAVCLLFFACGSDSTTGAPNPRTLTVAIKNLEATDAVHVYFETGQPGPDNLVNAQSSIQTIILAHGVGHIFSVYVDDAADPGGTALLTINVEVTATSYNSGTAELQWTRTDLLGIGWNGNLNTYSCSKVRAKSSLSRFSLFYRYLLPYGYSFFNG